MSLRACMDATPALLNAPLKHKRNRSGGPVNRG